MLFAVTTGLATACNSLEDKDYYSETGSALNNEELVITNETSENYIKQDASLSKMNALFEEDGIYEELNKKGQVSTILVVPNSSFVQPSADSLDYIVRSHVSDISISPSNLTDGERLLMWHSKYVNITMDEKAQEGAIIDHIKFNNAYVKRVVKTSNGYIYVISDMISTPTSLSDFIDGLGDDYSIFKNMVLASREKTFDKTNSKAIGVNAEGNTVYDSVFIYKNSFFDSKGFDMNSESLTATMLLFSNDVIEKALSEASAKLFSWGLDRNQDTIKHWILKTAFFNKRYSSSTFEDTVSLSSIYSTKWSLKTQKVDAQNPTELSNAIVYNVEKLTIPLDVLVYRLKDYFYYYEYCSDTQKEEYFVTENLTFSKCDTRVDAWTPWQGVWPAIQNRVLTYTKSDGVDDLQGFQLDFTPIAYDSFDGTVRPYTIPPGTYKLCMGFEQNAGVDLNISVLVDNKAIASNTITIGSSTTFHYDRGAGLYPEGYESSYVSSMGGNSKAGNYDRDGGTVIDEVKIPDDGNGTAKQIKIRIICNDWATKTLIRLHHWCLRPVTSD